MENIEMVEAPAHSDRPHAKLSPSKLKAKAICPGFENDPFSENTAAARGTLGHEAVEKNDASLCGDDLQLRKAVEMCSGYKQGLIAKLGTGAEIHQEIQLNYLTQWGFCDFVGVNADKTHAELADWKFAYTFYAGDAPQFWAYCVGIWDRWPTVETICTSVAHPFKNKIDVENFSRTEHYGKFVAQIKSIEAKVKRNDPEDYTPSAQCAYCGFAGKCTKLAKVAFDVARRYDDSIVPELPEGSLHGSEITDPNVIATLLKIAPAIEKAAKGWRLTGKDFYFAGIPIPGFDLAERAGKRSLGNALSVHELVKDKIPLDQFLSEACTVNYAGLEDLYASTAPPRQKGKYKDILEALLTDADLLNAGKDGKFLRAVKA